MQWSGTASMLYWQWPPSARLQMPRDQSTSIYRIARNFRGFRGLEFYTKIKSTKSVR